jgi:hypothetical protein
LIRFRDHISVNGQPSDIATFQDAQECRRHLSVEGYASGILRDLNTLGQQAGPGGSNFTALEMLTRHG